MPILRLKPISRAALAASLAMLLASCSDRPAYNKSYDIAHEVWRPADTLSFAVCVKDSLAKWDYDMLARGKQYGLKLIMRYSDDYQYVSVPVHVRIDTIGSYELHPKPTRPATWSWFMQDEFDIKGIRISFADTGLHHIKIYPDTVLTGLSSFGLVIQEK